MSITITEFGDHHVIQRAYGGVVGDVYISGTYVDETPTNIYYRILWHSDESVKQDWAVLDSSPGGGTFSGTVEVPIGGWYKVEVRIDTGGSTDKTSNKWGVGIVITVTGQSLITGGDWNGTDYEQFNDLCGKFWDQNRDGAGQAWAHAKEAWQGQGSSPFESNDFSSILGPMLNTVISNVAGTALENIPFAITGWSEGGTGINYGTFQYRDRNEEDHFDWTTMWGKYITHIQAYLDYHTGTIGPEYWFHFQMQADADTGLSTKWSYSNGVNVIKGWYEEEFGYIPKMLFACSKPNFAYGSDWGRDQIEQAHIEFDDEDDHYFLGCQADYNPGYDGLHMDADDHKYVGDRVGIALSKVLLGIDHLGPTFDVYSYIKPNNTIAIKLTKQCVQRDAIAHNDFEIKDSLQSYTPVFANCDGEYVNVRVSEELPNVAESMLNRLQYRFQYGKEPYMRYGTNIVDTNGLLVQRPYGYQPITTYYDNERAGVMTTYILGEGDRGGKEGTHTMTFFLRQFYNQHVGDADYLVVRYNTTPAHQYSVMDWDISSIPDNFVIESATIRLLLKVAPGSDVQSTVHKMLSEFVVGAAEATATNGQSTWKWKVADTTMWDNNTDWIDGGSGVDWEATVIDTIDFLAADTPDVTWYSIDVTDLCAAQLQSGLDYLRVLLKPLTASAFEVRLYAQSETTEAYRPELVITGALPSASVTRRGKFNYVNVQGETISNRAYHRSIVHNENLFVVMGYNGAAYLNDMYWTNNVQSWKKRTGLVDTDGNAITARQAFGLCKHNEKIYLMGGYSGSLHNDVYVSDNMFRWTKQKDAPWSGRYGFGAVSFNGKLWVIGGLLAAIRSSEVWSTTDGVRWSQENDAPLPVNNSGVIVFNNKVYIIGGRTVGTTRNNQVWCSQDMRSWAQLETDANFSARDSFGVTLHNVEMSRIVIIGGRDNDNYFVDMFHSGDGNGWHESMASIPMGARYGHSVDYFNSRLVLIGGSDGTYYKGDVWEANKEVFAVK